MKNNKIIHLNYCLTTAGLDCNEKRHPQEIMKELNINYQYATPQSIGNQWWFWNCENIPNKLPKYLTELKVDPLECIGFGLNEKEANNIINYKKNDR